jgi:hypothetical protein
VIVTTAPQPTGTVRTLVRETAVSFGRIGIPLNDIMEYWRTLTCTGHESLFIHQEVHTVFWLENTWESIGVDVRRISKFILVM